MTQPGQRLIVFSVFAFCWSVVILKCMHRGGKVSSCGVRAEGWLTCQMSGKDGIRTEVIILVIYKKPLRHFTNNRNGHPLLKWKKRSLNSQWGTNRQRKYDIHPGAWREKMTQTWGWGARTGVSTHAVQRHKHQQQRVLGALVSLATGVSQCPQSSSGTRFCITQKLHL